MDRAQVLAFRAARSGLDARRDAPPVEAVGCPISDFSRDAALLALGARMDGLTRERYEDAVDSGELAVAHVIRGAIHAVAPADLPLWGRALLGRDERELGAQLGRQVQRLCEEHGIERSAALAEVSEATREALAGGRALDKDGLHEELRGRVRSELLPWCKGCQSHHVAPMLWRYATIDAGVRLDAQRRYRLAELGEEPPASEAVRRYLRFYGPAQPSEFARWAGLRPAHGKRLWKEVAPELVEVEMDGARAWVLGEDEAALASPPQISGLRLLPPSDPFLQPPNRPLLAPDEAVRKRLFRPVASPGAVLADGELAGIWRARRKSRRTELEVEELRPLPRDGLEQEAQRLAELRGDERLELTLA